VYDQMVSTFCVLHVSALVCLFRFPLYVWVWSKRIANERLCKKAVSAIQHCLFF
jgi:hypothetical protein